MTQGRATPTGAKKGTRQPSTRKPAGARRPKTMAPRAAPREPVHGDREQWLQRGVARMHERVLRAIAKLGLRRHIRPPPQISCSYPPGGRAKELSVSQIDPVTHQGHIAINPIVGHGWNGGDPSVTVLALILHELIHLEVGPEQGHRGDFQAVAFCVGLPSPVRVAGGVSQVLEEDLCRVVDRLGPYPHNSMPAESDASTGHKKDKNRQRKYVCSTCGKIVRCAGDELHAIHLCDGTEKGRKGSFIRG